MDLSHLIDLCIRYNAQASGVGPLLPGLSILHREAQSDIESVLYQPVVCLILQGRKWTSIGDQYVDLKAGDALLVSHDLPVVSRITEASRDTPYIAVILTIDLELVRGLYDQLFELLPTSADDADPSATARSLSLGRAEPSWVDPLMRYFDLGDNPMDAKVLGSAIRREIHYRLLLSPIGGMLRNLLVADSHASRIARAIDALRTRFDAPLSVSDLARTAGMSASSFHGHFKAITGTTPIQYQKDLRLIEARSLLVERNTSVTETAYAVGYESPTHFSRDYSRKFGQPPSRATRPGATATAA